MNKLKVIILLLFLFISLVFALEWGPIIEAVDKAYRIVGLKTPSYILTIIEKESGFGEDLGINLGAKEKNLDRCINMCYWTREKNKVDGKKLVYCFDKEKQEYTIEARTQWCNNQYSALEKIASNLGLDINKVPFSPDFGIGYTQFQPTTWLQYKELKNKNPWNLEDSLYAAALKLKYDGINENERKAIGEYNRNPKYQKDYLDKRQVWDQILDDTIFVYDCPSNNFSCALSMIKTNYSECTENNWSVKEKKECIKTKIALQKDQKLVQKQSEAETLVYEIKILGTEESALAYIKTAKSFLSNLIDLLESDQASYQNNRLISQQISLVRQNNQQKDYQINKDGQKEEKITYQEEKKEIVITIKNPQTNKVTTTVLNLDDTILSTTPKTNTSTISTSSLRQQIISTLTEMSKSIIYGGGGGLPSPLVKDFCNDYKNKNYSKIIINEVQFETVIDAKDEFVELYNPNSEEIDLTCWQLEKYASRQNLTSTPTLTTLIPSSKFQGKIKPNGYFLITSSSTKEKYQGDLFYAESYSISKNNVILLRKPNGEISDLVGYGDDPQKIYQSESFPFTFQNFENKSIQRKNFQDADDNSKDFWLHKPFPKNSSVTEFLRQDFIDLTTITIQNFNVVSASTEDGYFLNISFNEPTATFATSTNNYSYELLISTSTTDLRGSNTDLHGYTLSDFGITSTFPSLKFDGSTTTLSFEITKCPTTSTTYYFSLFIKDILDEENKSNLTTSSTTLPDDLCNKGSEPIAQNNPTRILFSEIKIIEGTSTGEFVELYNPNNFEINLADWRIEKINSKGKASSFVAKSKFNNMTIKPFSYFLLINSSTLETITTTPDIIYGFSYDLSKNNGLRLIDKDNKIIDEVCWGDVDNYLNCAPNPSNNFSLQRKKTTNSTQETILDEYIYRNEDKIYLGNAYDTDNSFNDFIYAENNPENSNIAKPTIKEITGGHFVQDLDKKIVINWLSPAFYDNDLSYYLEVATKTDIFDNNTTTLNFLPLGQVATFTLPNFSLLSNQQAYGQIDLTKLGLDQDSNINLLLFKLYLRKGETIILDEKLIGGIELM